jgi:hypothetical protein
VENKYDQGLVRSIECHTFPASRVPTIVEVAGPRWRLLAGRFWL